MEWGFNSPLAHHQKWPPAGDSVPGSGAIRVISASRSAIGCRSRPSAEASVRGLMLPCPTVPKLRAWYRYGMLARGPAHLFIAWAVHDVEEAVAFPSTCDALADRTGVEALRMDQRQSWLAVGLMGVLVALACRRGTISNGHSRFYRAMVAGLQAHVGTHLLASVLQHRYTAGVATALPVMLPGAESARRELRDLGEPLRAKDYAAGAALLLPAALGCQALARMLIRRR